MEMFEFADVIRKDIVIRRYANQDNRVIANFEHCETKRDSLDPILASTYGDGESIDDAIADYCEKITGKILVFDAGGDDRQEFTAPVLTCNTVKC
jgi:hypothetical protein